MKQHQYQLGEATSELVARIDISINTSVSWEGKWQQGLQCRYPGLQSAHCQQAAAAAAAALRRCLAAPPDSAATAAAGPSHLHGVHPTLWTQLERSAATTGRGLTQSGRGDEGRRVVYKL